MSGSILTRQLILDAEGKPIGIILPIEEYRALSLQAGEAVRGGASLFGALRHLGGHVADTKTLESTRRELWASWERESNR
jgi:hypothetical protein